MAKIRHSFVCGAVIRGCLVRELYIRGEEQAAHEELFSGEKEARLLIALANLVEKSIRSGMTFFSAIENASESSLIEQLVNLKKGN